MRAFALICCCILFVDFGTSDLIISTFSGTGNAAYSGDGGPAIQAGLRSVHKLWIDSANRLFLADYYACTIRVISLATGIINRFAGIGNCNNGTTSDNTPATSTLSGVPSSITSDTYGNVFYTDRTAQTIRQVNTQGIISTIAGANSAGYVDGDASSAKFNIPISIWMNSMGDFYISDNLNCAIRKLTKSTNKVTTIMGQGPNNCNFNGDNLPSTSTQLSSPFDAMEDTAGNLFVLDNGSQRVRLLSASTGLVTTFAGTGLD
eukprot:gene9204-9990_t